MKETPFQQREIMKIYVKMPPNYWKKSPNCSLNGVDCAERWHHYLVKLQVLRSISTVKDGSKWIHVSATRMDRCPTWQELSKVKDDFIGAEKEAYQVLARDEDHVNLATTCLHIWAPIDGVRRVANLQDLVNEELP